jgi:hypothetical protein
MRTSDTAFALVAGIVLFTVACQGAALQRKAPSDSASVATASATDASIDSVDAELDSLVRFGPAHMETIISRHTLTTSNMLAGMAADLQRAGVAGDAAWVASVDSVRQDLTRMGKLSEQELVPFLQAHTQLIHRVTQQYHTLMSKAPPPAR